MFRVQPVRRLPATYSRSVWNDFDKIFDDFFNEPSGPVKMKVDILDQEDRYLLEADLPGFTKEDIDVSFKEDYLTIKVERSNETEDGEGKYLRRERSRTSYKRTFYIEQINEEAITAAFENGVLRLELPKQEVLVNEAKQIEIK